MGLNKSLLESLKDVRCTVHKYLSTGEKPEWFDPELGICNAVSLSAPPPGLRARCLRLIMDLAEEWPEFSGSAIYPVPHPTMRPGAAFDFVPAEDMWSPESAYGAARLRLLDWLISQLEAETRKETQNDHP